MEAVFVVLTVVICIVYFLSALFSFLLNGLIILAFILTKKIRTPTSLIIVNLSVVSIIADAFSPFTLTAFLTAVLSCDCTVLYYRWLVWQIVLFGVYPFNILLLTIAYLAVLKFSAKFLTFTKAITGLVIIWILSILCNLPTPFVTTETEFVDCCETVCMNGSALCNNSLFKTFTPRISNPIGRDYYNYRDLFVLLIPALLIFITSAGSYFIYRRSAIKSNIELELRMLLLPIIMTLFGVGYFILEDAINWTDTAVDDERFPGIIVYATLHMFWDTTGVTFALVILFFNVSIRHRVYQMVFQCIWSRNINTVNGTASMEKTLETDLNTIEQL